jgi:thiamine kinase-like enzyme
MRSDTLPADIDSLLDRLQCVGDEPRTVQELPGGLTNRNLRVTTARSDVVVRISSKQAGLLGIDRQVEHANSLAAAESGAAPAVVEYVPDAGLLVIEYIKSRTFAEADVGAEANLPRIAEVCRLLHSGRRFVNDFDMAAVQERYRRTAYEVGARIPDDYDDFGQQVRRLRAALAERPAGTVPCNNDLLAANILDDGSRLWLIDFEYSGNNDPCFELGNLASESHLSADTLAALVTHYFGRHSRHKVARAQLYGVLANYGWTLWAAIQAATSTIDFDFWSWGMDKYDRAVKAFTSPAFDSLLSDATRPD